MTFAYPVVLHALPLLPRSDFVIFERAAVPGAFYEKFPRGRKLISINKVAAAHAVCSCAQPHHRTRMRSLPFLRACALIALPRALSPAQRFTAVDDAEFRMRHDWNSLLSDTDELKFGRYSKDYFPHAGP